MRFPAHSPDTASGKAADLLGDIVGRTGSAGAMVRTMAGSPSMLGGYLELSKAMNRSRLDRAISERISLAVQARPCRGGHRADPSLLGTARIGSGAAVARG